MTFDAALHLLAARRQVDESRIYAIAEVGSTAHGISNPETGEDFDCTAIWVPTYGQTIWNHGFKESAMVRSQPQGERSGPGDLDINLYTLRHFAGLLLKGNPSVLAAVYSNSQWFPGGPMVGQYRRGFLWGLAAAAASKSAGYAFLGYMDQQMERWRGERGQKNVSRPELVERYGFDTKYAGHILRLGYQGIEFLTNGFLTMPMPVEQARMIRSVRTGAFTEAEAMFECDEIRAKLKDAIDATLLPEKPRIELVGANVTEVYRHYHERE